MGDNIARGAVTPLVDMLHAVERNGDSIIGFARGMDQAVAQVEDFGKGAVNVFESVGNAALSVVHIVERIALSLGISAAGIAYMANRWAWATKEQSDFALQLGVTTGWLRDMQFAAEATGVGTSRLNSALQMFSRNLGLLKVGEEGGGPIVAFLNKVGDPVLLDKLKHASNEMDAFRIAMQAIGRQTDATMATALATVIFGGRQAGATMVRLAQTYPKLAEEAERYYNVNAEQQAAGQAAADKYTHAILDMGAAWEGMKTTVLAPLMDRMADLVKTWADFLSSSENRKFISDAMLAAIDKVQQGFDYLKTFDWSGLGSDIKSAFGFIVTVAEDLKAVIDTLREVEQWLNKITEAQNKYAQAVASTPGMRPALPPPFNVIPPIMDIWKWWNQPTAPPATGATPPAAGALPPPPPPVPWQPAPTWAPGTPKPTGLWSDIGSLFGLGPAKAEEAPQPIIVPPSAYRQMLQAPKQPPILAAPPFAAPPPPVIPATPFTDMMRAPRVGLPAQPSPAGIWGSPRSAGSPFQPVLNVDQLRLETPAAPATPTKAVASPGTDMLSALRDLLNRLIGTKPAALAANAPVGGTPPTGITISAVGPNVHVTQSPPAVNVAVSVSVLKPDDAPAATATAVGQAIGDQVQSVMSDVNQ